MAAMFFQGTLGIALTYCSRAAVRVLVRRGSQLGRGAAITQPYPQLLKLISKIVNPQGLFITMQEGTWSPAHRRQLPTA